MTKLRIIRFIISLVSAAAAAPAPSPPAQPQPAPVVTPAPAKSPNIIYLTPEKENPTGEDILKFLWEHVKPDLNNLRVRTSSVTKSSYDLLLGFKKYVYDDESIVLFHQNGSSTDVVMFRDHFSKEIETKVKYLVPKYQQYILSYPEQNLESSDLIPIEKIEKRYGDEIIFYSVSPDNKAIFIMTKHLIILAELDGNEISRDIVSIDRYRQEDYKQPSLLYWVAKPTPENKLQYEYPLRDYSTIHSLSRNEAYFFKWQFGKDPNNLNMYTYNFGGAYYENKYDSICLVQKEDPEPTEFKMWRRLKSFAQFKNPDNKIMIEKINKVLQEAAQDYLDSGFYEEIDAKTAFDDDLSRELRIAFGAYNRSYTPLFDGSYIIVNDVNRVSVYLYNWGFNEIVNFNGAGDIITLDDIFKVDEEIYLQRLVDISKETIFNDDMDSYYPPSYDESRWDFGTDGLKNNCAIGKDFIIVFHGIIASQASGEHMVVIPFSMLGDILEDEYK